MENKSWKNVLGSEKGFTLLEIMISLVIVCMFAIVITQFVGISFNDVFNKGNKMQATATAQDLMETVTAIAENNPASELVQALSQGLPNEIVTNEADLLAYNPAQPVRFHYTQKDHSVKDSNGTEKIENGIEVSVVSFYNNGAGYVRINNFIITGKI